MTALIPIEAGIALLSGTLFDYDNPGAEQVAIEDIATGLSNVCRFAGQVDYFYSVAQHAVNTSYIVAPEFAYDALMHDTAEAFTNDIPTPLKFKLPIFKELELKIEAAMAEQFGFAFPLPPAVKVADLQMLVLENQALRRACPLSGIDETQIDVTGLRDLVLVDLSSWSPAYAKKCFLHRYEELSR
jgi:hypothetical protein